MLMGARTGGAFSTMSSNSFGVVAPDWDKMWLSSPGEGRGTAG